MQSRGWEPAVERRFQRPMISLSSQLIYIIKIRDSLSSLLSEWETNLAYGVNSFTEIYFFECRKPVKSRRAIDFTS